MLQGTLIDLTLELSLFAAKLGVEHKLLLTDSIIYATGLTYKATIWTQDADFKGLSSVKYIKK